MGAHDGIGCSHRHRVPDADADFSPKAADTIVCSTLRYPRPCSMQLLQPIPSAFGCHAPIGYPKMRHAIFYPIYWPMYWPMPIIGYLLNLYAAADDDFQKKRPAMNTPTGPRTF